MKSVKTDHIPLWLSYGATILLGMAFAIILLILVWNNMIDGKNQEFTIETASTIETISYVFNVNNDLMTHIDALIKANPELEERQFTLFSENIINKFPFINNIYYSRINYKDYDQSSLENNEFAITYSNDRHDKIFEPGQNILSYAPFRQVLKSIINSSDTDTAPTIFSHNNHKYFILIKLIYDNKTERKFKGIIFTVIDPINYMELITIPENVSLAIFSETSGIGGRNLLLDISSGINHDKWLIQEFIEENKIHYDSYSIKTRIAKYIYWQDIQKERIFIAFIIGLGITLLMIALVRAKELQARELRERNIVIEKTVEQQTRELAHARDQAVEGSRMKSDFLASMSHEIRTPLNAIIGMSELLSETELNQEQEKYINVFKRAGDTLLSLVNDILDLSKIEANQLELESIPFNLTEIVEESVEIYALKAGEKNIELICRIAPDIYIHRTGDPSRLRQIILNLISNALKFTENGQIFVEITQDNLHKEKIKFSVIDSGIGIAKDKCETIFESFTQADSSTTRKYGGTGLGLTISKSLVLLMNGKIWVESEQGIGSNFSFIIDLPYAEKIDSSMEVKQNLAGNRILLVNNNVMNTNKITEILNTLNIEVDSFTTGAAAKEKISNSYTDRKEYLLVIINYQLDDIEGHELIQQLTELYENINVALMVNPADINAQINKIKQYGVNRYLVKPIKHRDVIMLVNSIFNRDNNTDKKNSNKKTEVINTVKTKKILLVDDNSDNRLLIKAYLKKSPFDIIEAENGKIAVEIFQQTEFNLVLMDVHMPEMDGHEATRTIRHWENENQKSKTPIIALTAHATKEEIDKCTESGCDQHLGKPVKKMKLLETLNEYL